MCLSVCLSVCLYVYDWAAYERYQQLQYYKGVKKYVAILLTAFESYGVKTSEKANMHNEHWLTSTRFSPSLVNQPVFSGLRMRARKGEGEGKEKTVWPNSPGF